MNRYNTGPILRYLLSYRTHFISRLGKCVMLTDVNCKHECRTGLRIRVTLMRSRIRMHLFTSMRVRILLHINVMRICGHWSSDPPRLHSEPPLHKFEHLRPSLASFWALKLLRFEINADPNPAFKSGSGMYRYRTAAIVINEWKKQTMAQRNLTPRSDKKLSAAMVINHWKKQTIAQQNLTTWSDMKSKYGTTDL